MFWICVFPLIYDVLDITDERHQTDLISMIFIRAVLWNDLQMVLCQAVLVLMGPNRDFRSTHAQPLWSNVWNSDMTCCRQQIHWESFKCLLMTPSDSPQLCCWMLRKTWSNSANCSSSSRPADRLAKPSKRTPSQMLSPRGHESEPHWFDEGLMLEITWPRDQTEVKPINSPNPQHSWDESLCISRATSTALGALSGLAGGLLLFIVYTEVYAVVCSQIFHDFMFKSQ